MIIPRKAAPPPVANEGRNLQPTERFTKSSDLLIGLGLPPRLVLLYGKLAWHAGADGLCYPKHATLAREIGLGTRQHLQRLLKQLQRLKLIEWKRGKYSNAYRVLDPDATFMLHQMQHGSYISDATRKLHRKDSIGVLREPLKRGPSKPQAKSSQKPTPDLKICASADARGAGESALAKIPRSGNHHPGWFAAWWAIYWRKVAKKSAEKAFRDHVKTPERFAQVMTATKAQTSMMMARDPDKRPHGATWINGARWDDEPSTPATARKPPERQASLVERTKALWAKRLAKGERPI